MSKGCKVCHGWHAAGGTDEDCGHWCHFAGAEDWDTKARQRGDGVLAEITMADDPQAVGGE